GEPGGHLLFERSLLPFAAVPYPILELLDQLVLFIELLHGTSRSGPGRWPPPRFHSWLFPLAPHRRRGNPLSGMGAFSGGTRRQARFSPLSAKIGCASLQ